MASHIIPIMRPAEQPAPIQTEISMTVQTGVAQDVVLTDSPNTPEKTVRGTSVRLSVPLDSRTSVTTTRKLVRRDSMERREAILKGKEGSRQRRRWENDRLLNNPHAEPPLPEDWLIRPTYPVRRIPYYLAPLWDAAEFQRAVESKLKGRRNTRSSKRKHPASGSMGISPFEEAASSIPKEVKSRLKHARSAKGLLQDLEEDVRGFLVRWNEREKRLREEGLHDAPLPGESKNSNNSVKLAYRPKSAVMAARGLGESAVVSDSEEEEEGDDEEIVFVGRAGTVTSDSPGRKKREQAENLLSEKLVFEGLEDDKGASFGRWLTHCIGSYYGLRTWSVTTSATATANDPFTEASVVGEETPRMRQAYVGVDARVRGWMGQGWESGREFELPKPLWTMV